MHARGTFDVTMTPQGEPDAAGGASLGRFLVEKRFHGDLDGTGRGEMLTAGSTAVRNSAAYVLLERVTATLGGRRGSFVLHHTATMTRGAPEQRITIVPDTGTGELAGVTGALTITITGKEHAYDLAYALPGGS